MGEHKRKKTTPAGGGPRDTSKDQVVVMLPMARSSLDKLRAVHKEMRQRDPRTVEDYRVFSALTFAATIERFHAQVFPKLVQEPGTILGPNAPLPRQSVLPPGVPTADEFQRRLAGVGR